jgi:hypothetical protein
MSNKRAAVRFASRVANYSGLSHCHKVAWKHAASDLATGVQRYQLPAGMASFVRDDGTVIDLDEIGPIEVTVVSERNFPKVLPNGSKTWEFEWTPADPQPVVGDQ